MSGPWDESGIGRMAAGAGAVQHPPGDSRGRGGSGSGGVTDSRVAAAAMCADLRAGELLDLSFERRAVDEYRLDARDRRWTRELVYGMLRRRSRIDAFLNE